MLSEADHFSESVPVFTTNRWLTIRKGDLCVVSPSSVISISVIFSLADERRRENSVDRNGGKKLRPSAI